MGLFCEKTTETIKEQRQRREARVTALKENTKPILFYRGAPVYKGELGNVVKEENSKFEEMQKAENALQSVRDNLLETKKDGGIGIRGAAPLYKSKAGLEVIVPDLDFLKNEKNRGLELLYKDKLVYVCGIACCHDSFGALVSLNISIRSVLPFSKHNDFAFIPEGLIYCAEYEQIA